MTIGDEIEPIAAGNLFGFTVVGAPKPEEGLYVSDD
jgi:hypothetical protein